MPGCALMIRQVRSMFSAYAAVGKNCGGGSRRRAFNANPCDCHLEQCKHTIPVRRIQSMPTIEPFTAAKFAIH